MISSDFILHFLNTTPCLEESQGVKLSDEREIEKCLLGHGSSVVCLMGIGSHALSEDKNDWPRHRGDAALQGNSGQKIGSSLKLDWVFDAGDFLKSSVVVFGKVAYVGADTGIIHALGVDTGKEKWQYKTGLGIEAPPLVPRRSWCTWVRRTDFYMPWMPQAGKLKWKYETDGEIMGAANQAIRPESLDSVIVVGSYDNFVHCVDAKKERWSGSLRRKITSMASQRFTTANRGIRGVRFGSSRR